jgi:hypothetical protein
MAPYKDLPIFHDWDGAREDRETQRARVSSDFQIAESCSFRWRGLLWEELSEDRSRSWVAHCWIYGSEV